MRRFITDIESGVKLKIGDAVDSQTVRSFTELDPWDMPDTKFLLQADYFSEAIGMTRLYETFMRSNPESAWVYMGLCEKESSVNRAPSEARKVFICSPFAKDPKAGIRLAKAACYAAFTSGELPIAPHLYFTRFLHDEGGDGFEREWGIAAGHALMEDCDEIIVYVVDGYISTGMRQDIDYAVNKLALDPVMVKMSAAEAEDFTKTYLERAERFQGLRPTEE